MPYRLRKEGIVENLTPARADRPQLGDNTVPVGHQDRFSAFRQPDVLAQMVLENLDADGTHAIKVATSGHLVKERHPRTYRAASLTRSSLIRFAIATGSLTFEPSARTASS